MEGLAEHIQDFVPLLIVATIVIALLYGTHWLMLGRHPRLGNEQRLPRQLVMIVLTAVGAVVIALALPVGDSTRNQVIALIGVLVSAMIAYSATTLVSNFMAGIMLRTTRPFHLGDFIRVGEHFGRVADRGLFDTEIQTEHRDLVSFPNSYLTANPLTVVRSSGTVISAELSLGYDVHHSRIEALLQQAARDAGLDEPFSQIIELGNFAVTYRISGLLTDVKSLLTTRSNLHRAILDALHSNGIEIVSPTFMNQRPLAPGTRSLPPHVVDMPAAAESAPEAIIFDKAEEAAQRAEIKRELRKEIEALEAQEKAADAERKPDIAALLEQKRAQLAAIEDEAKQPPE